MPVDEFLKKFVGEADPDVAAYLENRKNISEKIGPATVKAFGAVDDEMDEFVDFEGIGEDAIADLSGSAEMSGRGPAPPTQQPGKSGSRSASDPKKTRGRGVGIGGRQTSV